MSTFDIITFGCKVNFAESSDISNKLLSQGFEKINISKNPEFVIINSCSVTNNADLECLKTIRNLIKKNNEVKIIITGCLAKFDNPLFDKKNIIGVFDNNKKNKIVDFLINFSNKEILNSCHCSQEIDKFKFQHAYSLNDRTRSFLKIQDGCNYWCSYCIIPQCRGCSRSDSIDSIISDAIKIRDSGVKEIVLTGINVGDCGLINNKREYTFYDLLCELDKITNIPRIRISSIEPNLLTEEIIELVKTSNNFVEHFHIPLQSGDDEILKIMRRRYNTTFYKNKILQIKSLMPYACIGIDVIVGFPGETEEKFMNTYTFLNDLPFSYLHVFPFSERNNTLAVELKNKITQKEKNRRVQILRELSNKKKQEFYKANVGRIVEVLFEGNEKNGKMYGYSDNYLRISAAYNEKLINKIIKVKVKEPKNNY